MSLKLDFGDFLEDVGFPALTIGVCAVVLAPLLGPALAKAGKPILKNLIKVGLAGQVVLAEARDTLEDLVAETKAEIAQNPSQPAREITPMAPTHSAIEDN